MRLLCVVEFSNKFLINVSKLTLMLNRCLVLLLFFIVVLYDILVEYFSVLPTINTLILYFITYLNTNNS